MPGSKMSIHREMNRREKFFNFIVMSVANKNIEFSREEPKRKKSITLSYKYLKRNSLRYLTSDKHDLNN